MTKKLKHILFIIVVITGNVISQNNLIQNSSFEYHNSPLNWETGNGFFFDYSVIPEQRIVQNWDVMSSPDYFTSKYTYTYTNKGVPNNTVGYCNPINGNAYAGIYTFIKSTEVKEYIYQHLNTTLIADTVYCLSFYCSLADRFHYSIKSLGAYFSSSVPNASLGYINAIPQVLNTSSSLNDTLNWMQVQGCFIAQGGEQYITIGNFNSNANTDTLYNQISSPLLSTQSNNSYYYIDSVTLYKQNELTSINKYMLKENFQLFPNPNNGDMQFTYDINTQMELVISDITGNTVRTYSLDESKHNLNISQLSLESGTYIYSLRKNNRIYKTERIVITNK